MKANVSLSTTHGRSKDGRCSGRPAGALTAISAATCVLLVAGPLLLVTACGKDEEKKVVSPPITSLYLPQSSPANCLANLKRAYESRDIEEYTKLFATDFVFVFTPDDVLGDPHIAPQWFLLDEVLAARGMFADSTIDRIALTFGPPPPATADSIYSPHSGVRQQLHEVHLEIHAETNDHEPLIYLVPSATEVFYLRPDSIHRASDGKPTFKIYRWEEPPTVTKGVYAITWGRLKALFQ